MVFFFLIFQWISSSKKYSSINLIFYECIKPANGHQLYRDSSARFPVCPHKAAFAHSLNSSGNEEETLYSVQKQSYKERANAKLYVEAMPSS